MFPSQVTQLLILLISAEIPGICGLLLLAFILLTHWGFMKRQGLDDLDDLMNLKANVVTKDGDYSGGSKVEAKPQKDAEKSHV